ncbi:MAG: hypothetical protein C0518_09295 [Opitutus sp.]|nr:hypothetical protein [Opitutus sp.]
MNTHSNFSASWCRALGLGAAVLWLAGCASEIGGPSYGYYERERPIGYDGPGFSSPAPGPAVHRAGYDYFPDYEVYYDRYRGEYIYVDRGRWVRSPRPRGFDVNVLLSTPSVHLEFRDSPVRHHREVIRNYPRGWRRAGDRYDPRYDRRW